jgi:hypothetical protein
VPVLVVLRLTRQDAAKSSCSIPRPGLSDFDELENALGGHQSGPPSTLAAMYLDGYDSRTPPC